jgi:hypothetical protein
MRSARSLLVLCSLVLLPAACNSPLDENIGRLEEAMRVVSDPELDGLPSCDGFEADDVRGGEVLVTEHDDLYAVSVGGALVCCDSGQGVNELQRRGLDAMEAADYQPLEGTPLPARATTTTTKTTTTTTTSGETVPTTIETQSEGDSGGDSGTPLPASH